MYFKLSEYQSTDSDEQEAANQALLQSKRGVFPKRRFTRTDSMSEKENGSTVTTTNSADEFDEVIVPVL